MSGWSRRMMMKSARQRLGSTGTARNIPVTIWSVLRLDRGETPRSTGWMACPFPSFCRTGSSSFLPRRGRTPRLISSSPYPTASWCPPRLCLLLPGRRPAPGSHHSLPLKMSRWYVPFACDCQKRFSAGTFSSTSPRPQQRDRIRYRGPSRSNRRTHRTS